MTTFPVPHVAGLRWPSRPWPWHQLPVHSPVALSAAWRSARMGLGAAEDSRPRVRALVRVLYEAEDAVLTGSGTQALTLALRAAESVLGNGGRRTVALPAYACYDVATAAVAADARIVLYDVCPETLAPDLASLTATLAEGARVVVVAPLYGLPVDWEAIETCTRAFGALAIEDAAQGHGAYWRGRPLGSLGRLSVLSFSRGKGWTAGRGGALLVRGDVRVTDGAPPECGSLSELGVAFSALAHSTLGRPNIYGLPSAIPWLHLGETRYHEPQQPTAISRTAAALLERTLPHATREAVARRANAESLLARIGSNAAARPVTPVSDGTPGFLRLPLRLARGLDTLEDPAGARRIGMAPGYPSTLAALPQVRERLVHAGRWPGADELVRQLVTVPTHSLVSAADREEMARLLERAA